MLLSQDPMTQLAFSIHENKGVFAVLIGSGLSRAAEIPTGWEITVDLIRRIGIAQGVGEQADWAGWYRERTGTEPNYSALLEELAASPIERRSILDSYIEPNEQDREEGRKVPTRAHLAIADLVRSGHIRLIITTNFDRLMENALRERGVEPTIVASPDALAGAEPLTHCSCYVLKLHGDYKDARILNTDTELSAYPPEYDRLLDRIFDEYGLIVAGWSGEWDHALRAAILRAPNRRYPMFWAARGALGSGAQELASHRGARVVPVADADTFFSGLKQRIDTLAQSRRQNPFSTELLVASTKRFLGRPEYRIQLDELFSEELERLLEKLDDPDFSASGGWDVDEFRRRVARYEAAVEPLAKVIAVLGRWGDDSEYAFVAEAIQSLYSKAESIGGGLVAWLNLRSYPAVLLFTLYGVSLTGARRWRMLRKLCFEQMIRGERAPKRMIETLFLWDWRGSENSMWQKLDGLEGRRTALSDHLCEIAAQWSKNSSGIFDIELIYARFELLASIAYIASYSEDELDMQLSRTPASFVRMPVGRVGRHQDSRVYLLQQLKTEAMRKALVDSGYVPSEKFLDLFETNLERISSREFMW